MTCFLVLCIIIQGILIWLLTREVCRDRPCDPCPGYDGYGCYGYGHVVKSRREGTSEKPNFYQK